MKRPKKSPERLRQKRTLEKLYDTSIPLNYEFRMFKTLTQGMASDVFGQGAINNAVLESFTLHARIMLDFLYATNKVQEDDVIAEDYFDNPSQWKGVRPSKTENLEIIHRRVGKEIAHLSYARLEITNEEKSWPFIKIYEDINNAFDAFLKNVAENRLNKKLIW